MDTKTIEIHSKDLSKAATSNDSLSSEKVLSLLSELRKGVKASEDLLRSTKIGITVNRLKQHKNPEVAKQANELVSKWRQDVRKAASNGKGGLSPSQNSPARTNGTTNGSTSNGNTTPTTKEAKKATVPPDQRSAKADGINTSQTGNPTRDNCLRLMYDGLVYMSEEDAQKVLKIAIDVEKAAYDAYQPETSEPYKTKMRSLFQNLKSKSNPQLRVDVVNGTIKPTRFVRMSLEDLKSAERRAEEKAMEVENMKEAMVAQAERSISTSLKCGKCGQRKVSYSQAQTRSADEPMTTFCECTVCGNRWKFC